ncbi:EamA family transporter [Stenotrophobium rhamnosiphilum]|uniref:EamA family transporter n=1 Tax=Stenotrophobium rhamnosiphilum TaxID=2029166 RepID=A0A2T5MDU4_9GAMM|nr:EamA family transporter [Stenotrophobium rhamnosiphilum]PTU30732.1 EamA family transporter [Stenotrophobium rhamnosiphilum]
MSTQSSIAIASNHKTKILLAFAIVYIVWGSTYLAIRVAVESIPPALCAGLRFDIAGTLILIYALSRGHRLPATRRDWFNIVFTGSMMLIGGNGLVTYSEQWVPSNQAALIVATGALWIAWFGTFGNSGEKLRPLTIAGLLIGFAGVAVLVGGGLSARSAPLMAYAALLFAPITWAVGSVHSRRHPVSNTPLMTAALQMLTAGIVMTIAGLLMGEQEQLRWEPRSLLAMAYLIVFGSCIAYAAYVWLVQQVTPALLGTYAYVNPAVAVLMGWLILDETLTQTQVIGTLVILAAVLLVTLTPRRRKA